MRDDLSKKGLGKTASWSHPGPSDPLGTKHAVGFVQSIGVPYYGDFEFFDNPTAILKNTAGLFEVPINKLSFSRGNARTKK